MSVPIELKVTVDNTDEESAWLPLNRFGDSTFRIDAVVVSGSPTYSLVGTQDNVLRGDPATAVELAISGFTDLTASKSTVQPIIFRAIKVKVTSGTGSVIFRIQSEGYC
jgi:hypothetical protein